MYTAAITAILLLVLIAIYSSVYKDTRARFSLGLTIFASILFVQNILSVFSFLTMASYVQEPFLPYLLGMTIAEALAVVALLRTTTR